MEQLAPILRVVLAISALGVAQCASSHSAPAPSVDCSSLVLTMADCLSFVSNGSTISKPEGTCCSGLKTVLKTDAECLCEAYKSSAQLGVVLNVTKALSLPAACDVSATSASKCALSISPASAPVESLSPDSSPAVDITAPPTTADTAPSTTAETAGDPAPAPSLGIGSSDSTLVTMSIGCLIASLASSSFLF